MVHEIDPAHPFPGFEADHLGGLLVWRDDFGMAAGEDCGFDMGVTLRIRVEPVAMAVAK